MVGENVSSYGSIEWKKVVRKKDGGSNTLSKNGVIPDRSGLKQR